MLQQFRHLFDHVVYGPDDALSVRRGVSPPVVESSEQAPPADAPLAASRFDASEIPDAPPTSDPTSRIAALLGHDDGDSPPPLPISFKHVDVIESPAAEAPPPLPDEVPMAVAVEPSDEWGVSSGQCAETEVTRAAPRRCPLPTFHCPLPRYPSSYRPPLW